MYFILNLYDVLLKVSAPCALYFICVTGGMGHVAFLVCVSFLCT